MSNCYNIQCWPFILTGSCQWGAVQCRRIHPCEKDLRSIRETHLLKRKQNDNDKSVYTYKPGTPVSVYDYWGQKKSYEGKIIRLHPSDLGNRTYVVKFPNYPNQHELIQLESLQPIFPKLTPTGKRTPYVSCCNLKLCVVRDVCQFIHPNDKQEPFVKLHFNRICPNISNCDYGEMCRFRHKNVIRIRPDRTPPSDKVPQGQHVWGAPANEVKIRPGARPVVRGSVRPAAALNSSRPGISSANVHPSPELPATPFPDPPQKSRWNSPQKQQNNQSQEQMPSMLKHEPYSSEEKEPSIPAPSRPPAQRQGRKFEGEPDHDIDIAFDKNRALPGYGPEKPSRSSSYVHVDPVPDSDNENNLAKEGSDHMKNSIRRLPRDVKNWSVEQVYDWAVENKLKKLVLAVHENEITGDVLINDVDESDMMDDFHMKKLEIRTFHRKLAELIQKQRCHIFEFMGPFKNWSVEQVYDWAVENKLKKLALAVRLDENEITGDVLINDVDESIMMDDFDMKKLEIKTFHRKLAELMQKQRS